MYPLLPYAKREHGFVAKHTEKPPRRRRPLWGGGFSGYKTKPLLFKGNLQITFLPLSLILQFLHETHIVTDINIISLNSLIENCLLGINV